MSEEYSQILQIEFHPYKTIVLPNTRNRPVNVTVSFSEGESVTTTVIIGGELRIKCADRPPTIIFDDVINESEI